MSDENEWRHTQSPARFLFLDCRAAYALLPLVFHLRLSTLTLVLVNLLIFWIMEKRGFTADVLLRTIQRRPLTFWRPQYPAVIRNDNNLSKWARE